MKMRPVNLLLFCVLASVLLCLPFATVGYSQQKKIIAREEGRPFSDGIVGGKTLYIAGQGAPDVHGKLKGRDIPAQTQATLENIARIVKQPSFQLGDMVAFNAYLADVHDFAAMNDIYK